MVNLKSVRASNSTLRSTAPGQVSLFIGATSGIAGHTLTEYTRHSNRPKIYIVGRSHARLSTITQELQDINPPATLIPIVSEITLLKNVDTVCEEVARKETRLDLLLMCPGYLKLSRVDNADGLEDTISLRYYVRMRFVQNLLPLLTSSPPRASGGSRIVSIHGAGREGHLIEDDLELRRNFSLLNAATHTSTMNTLALSEIAARHPSISCIHVFPGVVITPGYAVLSEDWVLPLKMLFRRVILPVVKLLTVGLNESGKRHCFHATSARYPPATVTAATVAAATSDGTNTTPSKDLSPRPSPSTTPQIAATLPPGVEVAQGWDGIPGSGFYLLDQNGEPTGDRNLLDGYRRREMGKRIWEHTQEVFDRVFSSSSSRPG